MVKIPLNKVLENCMGMGMTGILQMPQPVGIDACVAVLQGGRCCGMPVGRTQMLWDSHGDVK